MLASYRIGKSRPRRKRPGTRKLSAFLVSSTRITVRAHSSAEERSPYKRGVTGSNPVAPTKFSQVESQFGGSAVIEEVGRLLPVDVVSMSHYQAEGVLTFVARWGKVADRFPLGYQRALGGRNVGTLVFETGRPARVDGYADVAASGPIGAISREAGLLSSVGSPIIVDGRLWGMIAAGSTLERLSADTEARLASFTELVATAIANAESRAALARVARSATTGAAAPMLAVVRA